MVHDAWRKCPTFLYAADAGIVPLMPLERRETMVPYVVKSAHAWQGYDHGHYRVVFYWDGLLDPGDREKVSRFFC
jgi:hypothetical protein